MPRATDRRWDYRVASRVRVAYRRPAAIFSSFLILTLAFSLNLSSAYSPVKTAAAAPVYGTDSGLAEEIASTQNQSPLPTATPVPPEPTATPTPPPPPPWTRYTISSGENLSVIGSRYGVEVDSLVVANGLSKPNLIYPGENLYIPPAGWQPPWLSEEQKAAKAEQIKAAMPWLRYTVRPGDTLSAIAAKYTIDWNTLAQANEVAVPNLLQAGQVLQIPPAEWQVGMPIPPAQPSLQAQLPSRPAVQPVAQDQGTYTVRAGDNLSGIAMRYGVSMEELASTNQLASQNLIYVGQSLNIPGKGTFGGTSTAFATTLSYNGTGDESIMSAPSISPETIDRILQEYNSPAAGTGLTFYSLGVQYGIDPAFALAFFIHESSAGTQGIATVTRSVGNIRHTPGYQEYQGFRAYTSWEEGIADWYQLISYEYVQNWGLSSIAQIVPVYAPAVENDVPAYINAVMSLVYSWRGTGGYFGGLGGGMRANLVPEAFAVTSEFGHYPDGSPHYGLDLAVGYGTEQTAPVGGVVVEVVNWCGEGDSACGAGLGNHVWWRSAETGHYIVLGHLSDVNPALEPGAIIGAGAVLGITGATGWATGPHVHIQVNLSGPGEGEVIDPSWEFPWLVCGLQSPTLGEAWGNASCQ